MTLQRPPSQPTRRDDLLAQQAVEALEGAGTPLTAPDLAARLGAPRGAGAVAERAAQRAVTPAHVLQRLEQTLAQDDRFVRDSTGRWGLTSWREADDRPSPLLSPYAVLEVTAPSGPQASAVRLAGVRLRAGQIVDPYFAQFVPQGEAAGAGTVPALTGPGPGPRSTGPDALRPAAEVLSEVRAWLGDAVLVGQEVGAAVTLLNVQSRRLGQPEFENRVLDLAELAVLLVPDARRPSLTRVAAALGVAPRLRHPALGDARLVAEVLLAVLRRLGGQDTGGGPSLFGWVSGTPGLGPGEGGEGGGAGAKGAWPAGQAGARQEPVAEAGAPGSGSQELPRPRRPPPPARCRSLRPRRPRPPAPGCWPSGRCPSTTAGPDWGRRRARPSPLRRGSTSSATATGGCSSSAQAATLREQIAAHFALDPERGEPEDPWAGQAAAVEHTAVDCELDAILLAAEQLSSLHPAYRPRAARRYCPVLRFEGGTFLRAEPGHSVEERGAHHIGPYRNAAELRHTLQTIRRVFQIRTCSRRLPARRPAMRIPCERLAQQLCPAPCADLVTAAQYEVLVDLALLFVSAGKEATLEAIGRRLEALERRRNEGDEWEREMLAECRRRLLRVRKEYRPLAGGLGGGGLVMTYPTGEGSLAVFLVQDGRFLARFRISPQEAETTSLRALVEAHLSAQGAPAALDLSQTNVLLRWIFQHAGEPSLAPVPPSSSPEGVSGMIVEAVRRHFSGRGRTAGERDRLSWGGRRGAPGAGPRPGRRRRRSAP